MKKPIILAVTALLVLASCDSGDGELDDAPIDQIDDTPKNVVTNLDRYPNVSWFCIGANGIYTTTRDAAGAITIVANDVNCGGDPADTEVSG